MDRWKTSGSDNSPIFVECVVSYEVIMAFDFLCDFYNFEMSISAPCICLAVVNAFEYFHNDCTVNVCLLSQA